MVQICTPVFSAACQPDPGWTTGPWFREEMFGEPVPLKVRRFLIDAGVTARLVPPRGAEAFAYVIAGSGAAAASPPAERFALGTESMLWLGPCDELSVEAGLDGLDLMVAETTEPSAAEPPGLAGPRPRDEGTGPGAIGGFQGGRPPGLTGPGEWLQIATSPIVNVHVIYDRRVTRLPFAAAVDSPVQWVFDRTGPSGLRDGQYLAISLSAADDYADVPAARLRERFLPALAELFPAAAQARVVDCFVTRERRATMRQVPGVGRLRPGAATAVPGLVLAGAWTDTGWPDTMEGAVRSGLNAARELRRSMRRAAPRPAPDEMAAAGSPAVSGAATGAQA